MTFMGFMVDLPSGKRLQFANWNMAIEIVDLPIKIYIVFGRFTRGYLNECGSLFQHSKPTKPKLLLWTRKAGSGPTWA